MDLLIGEVGQGRVQRRLEEYGDLVGLVFGMFGEGSNDVHTLIETMATSRESMVARLEGRQMSDARKGMVVGQLRRMLSMTAVRANFDCLLSRMHQVGEGAAMGSRRREINVLQEERMRKERECQWLSMVRGGPLIRKGNFFRD